MGYSAVVVLDWLQPSASAVGAYVAASGTTAFALVLVTATNRTYGRQLSILLERRDFAALAAVRRSRLQWLIPSILVFLLVAFGFTRELIALFRSEFVEDGVVPLRALALAAAVSMLFSMAPTYLKFTRRNDLVFSIMAAAAISQGVLLVLLVPSLAATGAALAYAVTIVGLYGAYALIAHIELEKLHGAGNKD